MPDLGGLPALAVRPQESPIDQFGKVLGVQAQLQQAQMGKVQLQQAQRQAQDQATLSQLMIKHKGDIDKVIADAPGAGVSPNTVIGLQQHALDVKTKTADLVQKQGAVAAQQADLMAGAHDTVDKAPADQKPIEYAKQRAALQRQGIDVSQLPPEYPGDDQFKLIGAVVQGHKQQVADAMKEREVSAQELAANARMTAATKPPPGSVPLAADKIAQINQGLQQRWSVLNPGQPIYPAYQLPTNATKDDFDRVDKLLESTERAKGTQAQLATANAIRSQTAALAQQAHNDARSDKSYQFNKGELEKVAMPVEQAISRMGRLQDALAQNTPQADALIAPELLSVMAGGAGSGLRMNEAEIARIVGGRSKWQSLQAAINQWNLNPEKANSITPDQRQQIRALVSEVNTKLTTKQSAIQEARQGLISTDDPQKHREIVSRAQQAMTAVDQGASKQAPGPPAGATHTAMGSDGKLHWTDETGTKDLGVKQ